MGKKGSEDNRQLMKSVKINDIEWFLNDIQIADCLRDITCKDGLKREYFRINLRDREYFLKSFREKGITGFIRGRIAPRGKVEYEMGIRLKAMSIRTPEPIGYGIAENGSFFIQQYLKGRSLLDAFKEDLDRAVLLQKLAILLGLLKRYNIRHNDLHLDNLIVQGDDLYLIDLHKMRIKNTFTRDDEVSNISHALAMVYDDLDEQEKTIFFKTYGSEDIRLPTETAIKQMKRKWVQKKKERAFGETSKIGYDGEFLYIKGMEDLAKGDFIETVKADTKTRVDRYSDHIRKIYKNKRRLKKAWQSYVVLAYMNLYVTPKVYLMKIPQVFTGGYIAMEDLKGTGEELDRFLDRHYSSMSFHERIVFIRKISGFISDILRRGILHRDLKGCNIFVLDSLSFLLLDVEDIEFKESNAETLKRMFIQLNNTVPKKISTFDRIRFFLKVTAGFKVDKKDIFRQVRELSLKNEIVYEGISGLKREKFDF